MPFTNDDAANLVEQLAETRAQVEALKRALVEQAGALGAAQHLGDADYGPIIASALAVNVSANGQVTIKVTDATGRARTKFDTGTQKFAAFTTADLAAEIVSRWPQLAKKEKPAPTNGRAGGPPNLTEQMRRERTARRAAGAKLSDAERAVARAKNPWAPGTTNLTEQMRLAKRDPAFAAELQKTAT